MIIQVRNARRVSEPRSATGHEKIARFTVVLDDVITLYDYCLTRSPEGRLYCWPPYTGPRHSTASMHPSVREKIIDLVLNDIGDAASDRAAA